jgi:sarcosine oxidase subunit beta
MPWRLLRFALNKKHPEPRMFTPRRAQVELRRGHHRWRARPGGGLLPGREHGITNVCVLEKGYIGGGNTGRNTTIIRSNYLTPEGVSSTTSR